MSVGLLNILDVLTLTIMQYFSTIIRPSDFPVLNFRFTTFEQIPFDIPKWSVFTVFLATFTPILCLHIYSCFIVMWLSFFSILVPGEYF